MLMLANKREGESNKSTFNYHFIGVIYLTRLWAKGIFVGNALFPIF